MLLAAAAAVASSSINTFCRSFPFTKAGFAFPVRETAIPAFAFHSVLQAPEIGITEFPSLCCFPHGRIKIEGTPPLPHVAVCRTMQAQLASGRVSRKRSSASSAREGQVWNMI